MDENVLKLIAGGDPAPDPKAHDAWERLLPDPGQVFPTPVPFEWVFRRLRIAGEEGPREAVMLAFVTQSNVQTYVMDADVFEAFTSGCTALLGNQQQDATERPKG